MLVDLVKTTTSDGLKLDGALLAAADERLPSRVDALVCLHGVGGAFYGGSLFSSLTPKLVASGISVVWANTRGHDAVHVAAVNSIPRRFGAAYESVDECRYDLRAWVDFLVQRGHRRIGLLGHSLGAIKAVYCQAHEPHDAVQAVIALSPPRLSASCFNHSERSSQFFESLATAEQHVKNGQGDTLMEAKFPFPILITASGYVDKYGRDERYNIVRCVEQVSCPMLFTYGERELETGGVAFAGVPEALEERRATKRSDWTILTIAGADHSYAGTYDRLGSAIDSWLRTNSDDKS